MSANLSPPHGTSLGTTAGITSVITVMAGVAVLGQCNDLSGPAAGLAAIALGFLTLGAGALYAARNRVGQALDMAPGDAVAAAVTAARALVLFHLGMACVFAGAGFAIAFRLALPYGGVAWIAPVAAIALAAYALARAAAWSREAGRRNG